MQNLSASELVSLDAGFHTAREENDHSDNGRSPAGRQQIASQSDERRRTTEMGMAAISSVSSSSTNEAPAGPSRGASFASLSRSLWREQSLSMRSEAKQLSSTLRQHRQCDATMEATNDIDVCIDIDSGPTTGAIYAAARDDIGGGGDGGDGGDGSSYKRANNNGPSRPTNCALLLTNERDGDATSARRLFEKYHSKLSLEAQNCSCDMGHDCGPPLVPLAGPSEVRIQIDACLSFDHQDEEKKDCQSPIGQQIPFRELERRLDNTKLCLNEISNILAAPVAPPPSRASSEADLKQQVRAAEVREGAKADPITRCNSLLQLNKPLVGTSANNISSTSEILLGIQQHNNETGSLSDNSYKLTKYCASKGQYPHERKRQFEERIKNWKRSNGIITNIHENPISMHIDCLDRLSEFESTLTETTDKLIEQQEQEHVAEQEAQPPPPQQQQEFEPQVARSLEKETAEQQKQQQLNQYANHLTQLYRRNQEIMDSNSDFRTLLYNIICCLLVQDDQVLATPSVGKMLEVIRTHLDAASRVYSSTSSLLVSTNLSMEEAAAASAAVAASAAPICHKQPQPPQPQQPQQQAESASQRRRDSAGGWSCASSTLSSTTAPSAEAPMPDPIMSQNQRLTLPPSAAQVIGGPRSKKPADFRRVSSVSYNDQQLINDLCDDYHSQCALSSARQAGQRSGSLTANPNEASSQAARRQRDSWSPSPWAYQELCDRPSNSSNYNQSNGSGGSCAASQTQYTSQSSLEQMVNMATGGGGGLNSSQHQQQLLSSAAATATDSNQSDPMNDSGNGTMYEFQIASDFGVSLRRSSATLDCGTGGPHRSASTCSESLVGGLVGGKFEQDEAKGFARQRRRLSDFKPQQQPSYMSTDDYWSSTNNNQRQQNNRTSFYDDENSSTLLKYGCMSPDRADHQSPADHEGEGKQPVDVAGRRCELEWTLNKLINIELKHTWLTSRDTLRRAIRKVGVPNEIRSKVWLILIDQMIGTKYNLTQILEQASKTIEDEDENNVILDEETQSILKQIELDVNRTMPGHRLFDDGAEGGVKLRRILVAYSIHVNRAIAYCQGFNFIVALLLSVFEGDEEKVLSGFVCIVDHIFPSKYYFDHYLTGARADQFLLADFICDQLIKNPTMAERKMVEGVTSSITLNWFISLFHGAVPTLTRLTILDHFMLEGVKALFRFTMAILYLAFQVTPPSSCEIFQTIRNTAKDMYDIKLLLSIVGQIKLPKDSYFAIRRSFYMVQSSFNSDQFYMQSLSSEASRSMVSSKPLSVQQPLDTKPPALSFISSASFLANSTSSSGLASKSSVCTDATLRQQQQQQQRQLKQKPQQQQQAKPRIQTSADRSKVCVQSLGKLGRSHLRVIDTSSSSNERSLMSPLRNCLIIGISNCGKHLVLARQSSRRNYRAFREQDLNFHIHEIHTEIFDGFYLEERHLAIILTHRAEIFKIDFKIEPGAGAGAAGQQSHSSSKLDDLRTETLMLRESNSLAEHEKVKLRLSTMDCLTNLLWIYVECEDPAPSGRQEPPESAASLLASQSARKFKNTNPFLAELNEQKLGLRKATVSHSSGGCGAGGNKTTNLKASHSRKIIIVDIVTFDLFSAFAVHPSFGEITNLRASLVAFCQLLDPASNQFSTRIVQIGPTGRYEQLLSFSDVVDYIVSVPDSYKQKYNQQSAPAATSATDPTGEAASKSSHAATSQRLSSLRRLLTHSMSFHQQPDGVGGAGPESSDNQSRGAASAARGDRSSTLTRYYRTLMRSYSMAVENKLEATDELTESCYKTRPASDAADRDAASISAPKLIQDVALRSIVASSFGDFSELSETNYIPVKMAFIFRNGKIALFEFTESYAIHTRESQLDRYDYLKVIDVTKNGEDFIVTILTVFDKLIKVVI